MRRLLRAIARGEEITQDISTLENPGIVDQLRGVEQAPKGRARAKARKKPARRKPVPRKKKAAPGKKAAIKKRLVRRARPAPGKRKGKVKAKGGAGRRSRR